LKFFANLKQNQTRVWYASALLTSHHQECFPFLDGNSKYGSHGHSHHRAAAYLRCLHYDKTGNSANKM